MGSHVYLGGFIAEMPLRTELTPDVHALIITLTNAHKKKP